MPSAATATETASARIHSRLSHPVVDSDGHWIEYAPAFLEYLKTVAGPAVVERYRQVATPFGNTALKPVAERRARRYPQPPWWGLVTRTPDRAAAMLPRLLYERLDEIGVDFAVLYPSSEGLVAPFLTDDEVRRAACRAFNNYVAETFQGLEDRLTPAASIPMHTPDEAIEELEHVKALGLKAIVMATLVRRKLDPAAGRAGVWFDVIGLDSVYDYDPVWAKCLELGFAPTFHSGSQGMGMRTSVTNWVYNHIGHFAEANDAVCKALFLGGVTRRFPTLRFAFMEGGVSWAVRLLNDLAGHYRTRNPTALANTTPATLDREHVLAMIERYGSETMRRTARPDLLLNTMETLSPPEERNEFARAGVTSIADIGARFAPNFYFGCEAEEPTNAWAFNPKSNACGVRLKAFLGSDIGHFDVTDITTVLAECHELVEEGLLSEADFAGFTFHNPVRFWAAHNPDFFSGTVVEKPARAVLNQA